MKGPLLLVVGAVIFFLGIIVLAPRWDGPVAIDAGPASTGPAFTVQVEKPRMARPLFGLLPSMLESTLAGHGDLMFDHTSPGAAIGSVSGNRVELSAGGWSLRIETSSEGTVTGETHLVFSLMLANQQRTLRCRPGEAPQGHLHVTTAERAGTVDGEFVAKLALCVNTDTGQAIAWPPAPLTVRGSFQGLPDRTATTTLGSGAPDPDE